MQREKSLYANVDLYAAPVLQMLGIPWQLNTPVFIRWFWEMDGNKKQGFISSPASYQKAWRHIHDIFGQAGATNAVWVWCPNASAFDDGNAMPYYPGGAYVDWVCGDGYNFAPNRPGDKWETPGEIYNGWYAGASRSASR